MRARLGLCGAVAFVGLSSTAVADPKSDAAAAYAEGQQKFVAGDHDGAAVHFAEAYQLDADPAYLFNLAQAYRLSKQCAAASTSYKQFLADVPDAPNAAAVRGYITETDACAREQAAAKPPEPTPSAPVAPAPAPVVTASSRSNALAYGALGVAALGLVGGVIFQRQVGSLEDDRAALCPDTGECTWTQDKSDAEADLDRRGKRASAFAVTSYALGGAALVGGVVLMLRGRSAERDPQAVRVVPTSNGALVRWSF